MVGAVRWSVVSTPQNGPTINEGTTTVTSADIASLAGTLERMADRFDAQEQATLHALFSLAGRGADELAGDVSGFAAGFRLALPATQGILIGLNQTFAASARRVDFTEGYVNEVKLPTTEVKK